MPPPPANYTFTPDSPWQPAVVPPPIRQIMSPYWNLPTHISVQRQIKYKHIKKTTVISLVVNHQKHGIKGQQVILAWWSVALGRWMASQIPTWQWPLSIEGDWPWYLAVCSCRVFPRVRLFGGVAQSQINFYDPKTNSTQIVPWRWR